MQHWAPVTIGRRTALLGAGLLAAAPARAQAPAGAAPEEADVLVLGAGLSGMCCARRLHEAGKRVIVLEARDRVGGRNFFAPVGAHKLELGGQFIGPTQTAVRALITELGLSLKPTFTSAKAIWELADQRLEFGPGNPPLPWAALLDVPHMFSRINALAASVGATAPWTHQDAAKLDSITASTWLAGQVYTGTASDLATCALRAIFGADPAEFSALFLGNYVAQGDSFDMLTNTRNGAQDSMIVGGSQQISERLAAKLGDGMRLNDAVAAVAQDDAAVTVTTVNGRQYRAAHAVLAMPPYAANKILFTPDLPAARRDLQAHAPMGRYYKVIATYDRPFWREAGFSGEVASVRGPIVAAYDDEAADGTAAVLGFIGGNAASAWAAQDEAARRESALRCFARFFGDAAMRPLAFGYHDWSADWRQAGCPVMVLPPGVLSRAGAALRAPVGRLHFAGTEAAEKWTGYMDGAVRAGEDAARAILRS